MSTKDNPLKPLARKVLLIGWDAADWRVIDPLLAEGKMPNLGRFLEQGVRGNISTLYPAFSPMLWTSIATGKRPFKHGICGFTEPTPDGRGVRPISNLARKTKALWNILHQAGKTCNVVGWWPSHPAEPIRGVMVSNHYQHAHAAIDKPWPVAKGTVHPERLSLPLAEFRLHPSELDSTHIAPFVPRFEEVDQDKDRRLEMIARILADTTSIHGAATALMQLEPWDFMAVYHDGIDHFGHGFMKYHPPRQAWIGERDFSLYSGVMEAGYRFHDMMLGALLALAGDDTTVILMSDHGFHPDQNRLENIPVEPAGPAAEHRHYGILAMRGPGILAGERIFGASILDVCPTILRLFGLPSGRDMDGKVVATAFAEPPKLSSIPSWDEVPGDAGCHPPGFAGDPLEAAESLKQLIDLGYVEPLPDNREAAVRQTVRELRYNLALSYMDASRLAEAAAIAEPLWEEWPEEHRFGVALARCLATPGQAARRRAVLDRLRERMAAASRSANEKLQQYRGPDGEIKGDSLTDQQRSEVRRLIALASPDPGLTSFLVSTQKLLEGQFDEAAAELERQSQSSGAAASLQIRLGYVLIRTGRPDRAEAAFRSAIEKDEELVDAHLGLALAREAQGDFEGMLEASLAATDLIFHNPRAHGLVGKALLKLGQYDEAEKAFELALHQNPRQRASLRGLTELYSTLRPDQFKLRSHQFRISVLAQQLRSRKRAANQQKSSEPAADAPRPMARTARREAAMAPADQVVTIVSGLPRSGTSMMMQMLAAGGMVPYVDGRRAADDDNPLGYFEHDLATRLASDKSWVPEVRGKVVKIVAPLLPHLPREEQYAVVMMRRNLADVVASQRDMLRRLGRKGAALGDDGLMAELRRHMQLVDRWLAGNPSIRVLDLDYTEVLADPAAAVRQLTEFLAWPVDAEAMQRAVQPGLRRQRTGVVMATG